MKAKQMTWLEIIEWSLYCLTHWEQRPSGFRITQISTGESGEAIFDRVRHRGIVKPCNSQSNPFCVFPPWKLGQQGPGERVLRFGHRLHPPGWQGSWRTQDQPPCALVTVMEEAEGSHSCKPIPITAHACVVYVHCLSAMSTTSLE